jgi:hypothetical protein
MRGRGTRTLLAVAASFPLVLGIAAPGAATTETTVAFAGQARTAAVILSIGGETGESFSLAATESNVTSQGPASSGSGQVVGGVAETGASTDAPPSENATAGFLGESGDVGGIISYDIGAGEANSASVANGAVSTENDATVGEITLGLVPPINGESLFDFEVSITALTSASSAEGKPKPTATASASATGAVVTLQIDPTDLADEATDPICAGLGELNQDLGTACGTLFDTTQEGLADFLSATIADGECTTAWNGSTPSANGAAQLIDLTLLGEEIALVEGQELVIGEGTELESRIGAGAFTSNLKDGGTGEEDAASARATGALVELLGGQIALALGDATCGVSGKISTEAVIARTGANPAPLLAGGTALAAAGYGLRRFLRRGR